MFCIVFTAVCLLIALIKTIIITNILSWTDSSMSWFQNCVFWVLSWSRPKRSLLQHLILGLRPFLSYFVQVHVVHSFSSPIQISMSFASELQSSAKFLTMNSLCIIIFCLFRQCKCY